MTIEELFYKVITRCYPTESEQPEEGQTILKRLKDLERF